ncbi:MAG TPA: type II toxin-antitoxin system HicB family antitoxin [Methylomusa anaerophila]|uniref:HicB family protein n=1 Tax=Methylomusa anaerophila TaxID=1930071 RepID=A0A348AFY0_9FIRM|nr:type II toxin-antitoxin system HicB family antitoxin [Methylomusa anaerophila]BBB89978.1 HicB family protein [Methylomusa anaerophila]HML88294.1 type II toxin-antitoxin system HicB family antitoxin [Methylomusa anaerophila]
MPNEKNLDYYMSLPYREVIESSPEGGYVATIPDLKGCITQAETLTELVDMIKDAKMCWLESALDYGTEIPEPTSEAHDEYSGSYRLRIPKSLHKELAIRAKQEKVSLNSMTTYAISKGLASLK